VDKVVHPRVVARVALLQGEKQLAVLLGVPSSDVARWVEGLAPVPTDVFSAVAITWQSMTNRQRTNPKEQTKQCSRSHGTAEGRRGAC
jgi:hypothetical protein